MSSSIGQYGSLSIPMNNFDLRKYFWTALRESSSRCTRVVSEDSCPTAVELITVAGSQRHRYRRVDAIQPNIVHHIVAKKAEQLIDDLSDPKANQIDTVHKGRLVRYLREEMRG